VLIKEHRLSERQGRAMGHLLEHGAMTIQDFERLSYAKTRSAPR